MSDSSTTINFNYLFKYIIIGDSAVGKSNLLLRYTHNKFNDDYQATIGVEFGAKNLSIKDKIYRVQVWDTAGQENFRSITRAYYKNSVCALIVYDITRRDSFEHVQNWVEDCKTQTPKTVLLVLVGNKTDLESERKVSVEEGKQMAEKNGMLFYETCAKNGKGVCEMFDNTVNEIARRIEDGFYDLKNDNCGIKMGVNAFGKGGPVVIGKNGNGGSHKKGCC